MLEPRTEDTLKTLVITTIAAFGVALAACSSTHLDGPATAATTPAAAVLDRSAQAGMTPNDVLKALAEGNERFVKGELTPRDYLGQVGATAKGQYPMATILSCLDSRVPPEIIFDRGIGDLFVGRVAGNFENPDMLGSFEFATKLAGSKLIVVLGHTHCGAVKGACDGAELGNLTQTLANIQPAIDASQDVAGEKNSKNAAYVDAVSHMNVRQTVRDILARSEVLRDLVDAGELRVVGAMHDIETGRVSWLDHDAM